MAKPTQRITLGIDVSKDTLDCYNWQSGELVTLNNDRAAIVAYLKDLDGPIRVAVEPTSNYHLELLEAVLAADGQVYLVNPRSLYHYRQAAEVRVKNDRTDAWLLARYLMNEGQHLRPFTPHDAKAQRLWMLIKRRAAVVKHRQALRLSMQGVLPIKQLMTAMQAVLERIDRQLHRLVVELGWTEFVNNLRSIPGIGILTATALVAVYHRGAFASADAFVAFLGLDVRVRDSGQMRGLRRLTKNGEPELRRLLFCAALAAPKSHPPFDHYFGSLKLRGLSATAARCVLSRKLARVAFALLKTHQSFAENHTPKACLSS